MVGMTPLSDAIAKIPLLESIATLPPGITLAEVTNIAALVVEWAKARQEYHRVSHYGGFEASFEAYRARFDLDRRLAASVGLPAIGDAPNTAGAAHEP